MHSPDFGKNDIGGLIDQVERSDLLSWLRSLTEQQYRVVELYTEGYATSDIAQILSLDKQTVLNHKNRAVQKYKSIIPKVSKDKKYTYKTAEMKKPQLFYAFC